MASRLAPAAIRIRDALFIELDKIGLDDETKWHTRPVTKALHNGRELLSMLEAPAPAIFLRIGDKTPSRIGQSLHRDTVELIVYCVNNDVHDPELGLWNLMEDVVRAIREGEAIEPVIDLEDIGCSPHMEEVAGKAGVGFGIVRASAYYQSDHIDT